MGLKVLALAQSFAPAAHSAVEPNGNSGFNLLRAQKHCFSIISASSASLLFFVLAFRQCILRYCSFAAQQFAAKT